MKNAESSSCVTTRGSSTTFDFEPHDPGNGYQDQIGVVAYGGHIYISGRQVIYDANNPTVYHVALAVLNSDLTFDTAFGGDGIVNYDNCDAEASSGLVMDAQGRILMTAFLNGDPALLGEAPAPGFRPYYVQSDANYNVTTVTKCDSYGIEAVEHFTMDPYGGNVQTYNTSWAGTTESFGWAYFWQGLRLDAASGNYVNDAREDNVALKRAMQPDSIVFGDGMNWYINRGWNPVNRVDPRGTLAWILDAKAQTLTLKVTAEVAFGNNDDSAYKWTASDENAFQTGLKSAIEAAFNGTPFVISPVRTNYESFWGGIQTCPLAARTIKPRVQIDFGPPSAMDWDWRISAYDLAKDGPYTMGAWSDVYSVLERPSLSPAGLEGAAKGQLQTIAVHEFGHFLGLEHPGGPTDQDYYNIGKDAAGHDVDGHRDLMGVGSEMRAFYFQKWADYMNGEYPGFDYYVH